MISLILPAAPSPPHPPLPNTMVPPTILIIGAGPVGLTLALSLHRAGVPAHAILVADQRPSRAPTALTKALSLSASSLEVFRTLGLAERFLAAGVPLHKAHFGGGTRLLDLSYEVLGTKYPFNYSIPQTRTEAILLARCEEVGVSFAWGRTFVALEQPTAAASDRDEAVLVVTLEKSPAAEGGGERETITTSWLAGCDGTRSAVRQAAGISWTGTRATRYSWAVECAVAADAPGGLLTGADEGGRAMVYSLGRGRARFGGNFAPGDVVAAGGRPPTAPDEAYVREWAARTFGRDFGLHGVEWATVLGDGMAVAGGLRAGRVVVVGDAAHQLYPAGGQGMNTGLLDAVNLAWKLAMVVTGKITSRVVVERVLDSYTSERKAAVEAVVKNVRVQMTSLFSTGENERAVADFIAESLDQPVFNRLWATRVTGFGDPTEPYQHASRPGDELVGTRLTHVADTAADDVLQAVRENIFILARVCAVDGKFVDLSWAENLFMKYPGLFKALDGPLEATSSKWAGVEAVLLRPDLRVAWVLREGSDPDMGLETLSSVLSWWCGEPSTS